MADRDLHQVENSAAAGSFGRDGEAGGDPRAELVQVWWNTTNSKPPAQLLIEAGQMKNKSCRSRTSSLYNDEVPRALWWFPLVIGEVFQQVMERPKEVSRIESGTKRFPCRR